MMMIEQQADFKTIPNCPSSQRDRQCQMLFLCLGLLFHPYRFKSNYHYQHHHHHVPHHQGRASQLASLGRGVAAPFVGFARFRHEGEGKVFT